MSAATAARTPTTSFQSPLSRDDVIVGDNDVAHAKGGKTADELPQHRSVDWDAEFSAPDVGLATRMLLRVLLLGALGTFSLKYLSWYMMPIGFVLMGLCFYGLQVRTGPGSVCGRV